MLPSKRFHQWTRKAGLCLLMGLTACGASWAQDVSVYSNRMVFSGFVEYSNDSSHMLLGYADGRKINALGASFEIRSFLKSNVTGSWLAEVRPYMTVTDPTMTGFMLKFPEQPTYSGMVTFASPVPVDKPVNSTPLNVILVTQNQVYAGTATYVGGTRSTYVSGFSPLGYKVSAFPHRVERFRGFTERHPGLQQLLLQLHFRIRRRRGDLSDSHPFRPDGIPVSSSCQHQQRQCGEPWYRFGSFKSELFLRPVSAEPKMRDPHGTPGQVGTLRVSVCVGVRDGFG
jgi:hypothetical protein